MREPGIRGPGVSPGKLTPDEPFRPDPAVMERLEPMLKQLAASPVSLSSVTDPVRAREVHLADSLCGLLLREVADSSRALDLGAGAGFPGIPLALALPATRFTLIDSVGRKVDFMREVIAELRLRNAVAVNARSEDLARGEGRESFDLLTVRAVAPLDVLAELGSPLLATNGSLVAWKGEREREGEAAVARISGRVAMTVERILPVRPYPSSRMRHLYLLRKTGPTPEDLPRRPGIARKRPLAQ